MNKMNKLELLPNFPFYILTVNCSVIECDLS